MRDTYLKVHMLQTLAIKTCGKLQNNEEIWIQNVMLDWAQWFLYHVLVAYSVSFVLGIKSVRSLGCLLYSLYS